MSKNNKRQKFLEYLITGIKALFPAILCLLLFAPQSYRTQEITSDMVYTKDIVIADVYDTVGTSSAYFNADYITDAHGEVYVFYQHSKT